MKGAVIYLMIDLWMKEKKVKINVLIAFNDD